MDHDEAFTDQPTNHRQLACVVQVARHVPYAETRGLQRKGHRVPGVKRKADLGRMAMQLDLVALDPAAVNQTRPAANPAILGESTQRRHVTTLLRDQRGASGDKFFSQPFDGWTEARRTIELLDQAAKNGLQNVGSRGIVGEADRETSAKRLF